MNLKLNINIFINFRHYMNDSFITEEEVLDFVKIWRIIKVTYS
jgi:hypothetical protein